VVDNAGSDETALQLPHEFPWVRFLRSESNLGFTRGNNRGYQISRGEIIFFLNPDTALLVPTINSPQSVVRSLDSGAQRAPQTQDTATLYCGPLTMNTPPMLDPPNAIWQLYQTLTSDPTIGMVGPQLRYGDGSWQNNRRCLPTPLTGFWESTWLGQLWPNNPWARAYHMTNQPATVGHEVEWIMGSAMFVWRVALEAVRHPGDNGPFDEDFFMYSEEMDLCHRLRLAGWRIVYEPAALMMHYEGRSSEQVVAARHIRFNTSKVHYYEKYFGHGWAMLLRHYLLFEFRLQLVIEWLKLQLGHEPALRQARITAYQQVLRSQLLL